MLKYTDTEVVFDEVPNEITLAINISNCPFHCPGCHSPELWEDVGNILNQESLSKLIRKNKGISCVSFMGGDVDIESLNTLFQFIKKEFPELKVAWYSGRDYISDNINLNYIDFIKIGPYRKDLGGLDKKTTNQIMYKVDSDLNLIDITNLFWK
jgi:anaerobic ribonucleoside-triphosphate reductase activating protein